MSTNTDPWYPPTGWIEVPPDLMAMPAELKPDDEIEVLLARERRCRKFEEAGSRDAAEEWVWSYPDGDPRRIVAYRKIGGEV